MENSIISSILTPLQMLLWYGVMIVGMILAVKHWRKHRMVSIFAFVAYGVMLISSMARIVAVPWVVEYLQASGYSRAAIGSILNMIGVGQRSIYAITLALLLCAIFIGRLGGGSTTPDSV